MQDFTGVPCVVDLATMREAMEELGGDPEKINPLAPAEMVIDHSVMIDVAGRLDALEKNMELEYERNRERYQIGRASCRGTVWASESAGPSGTMASGTRGRGVP